jgi:hypothetical protein
MEQMKKLVDVLYELSVVSALLDEPSRLVKAQEYVQDVIGDLEEKIYG